MVVPHTSPASSASGWNVVDLELPADGDDDYHSVGREVASSEDPGSPCIEEAPPEEEPVVAVVSGVLVVPGDPATVVPEVAAVVPGVSEVP
jgi:hypothetical protein